MKKQNEKTDDAENKKSLDDKSILKKKWICSCSNMDFAVFEERD
jgi:hypothetical protein